MFYRDSEEGCALTDLECPCQYSGTNPSIGNGRNQRLYFSFFFRNSVSISKKRKILLTRSYAIIDLKTVSE